MPGQRTGQKNPKDIHFELNEHGIPPDLNVHDLEYGKGERKRRHLVCYSDKQARILKTKQRWYMDGTFKIVKKPFVQLYTIHSFIRVGGQKKMVPLMHILMSQRTRQDYKKIFKYIKEQILNNETEVTQCVVDFEKAVWRAMNDVFGATVKIFGCGFHWTQCIFRRIKKLGLTIAYKNKEETLTRNICRCLIFNLFTACIYSLIINIYRKIMCLHLLPHGKIGKAFEDLWTASREIVDSKERTMVRKLCEYVEHTWISSELWSPVSWSVFMQKVTGSLLFIF